ncbi:DUF4157 domain-containing protein [Cryptosporangium japonicum]|uniref:eCIS core domain-containing protein n=1 Tax=Cryptosporangium japonicum TaxID=80872 RepID=A0ABP3DWZ3_9ACTN
MWAHVTAAGAARPDPPRTGAPVPLQRLAGNAAIARALAGGRRAAVAGVLGARGVPLRSALRAEMESRLGADFSEVRLHSGPAAAASAAALDARAYTSGEHVVLGAGGADRHTLAHELTHVIQQREGAVAGTATDDGLTVSDPSDAFERAAETDARRALSGAAAVGTRAEEAAHRGTAGGTAVQRMIETKPNRLMQQQGESCWLFVLESVLHAHGAPTTSEQILMRVYPSSSASSGMGRALILGGLAVTLEQMAASLGAGPLDRAQLVRTARTVLGDPRSVDALDFLPSDPLATFPVEPVRAAYAAAAERARAIQQLHQDTRAGLQNHRGEPLFVDSPFWAEEKLLGTAAVSTRFTASTPLEEVAADLRRHRPPSVISTPRSINPFATTDPALALAHYDFTGVPDPLRGTSRTKVFVIRGADTTGFTVQAKNGGPAVLITAGQLAELAGTSPDAARHATAGDEFTFGFPTFTGEGWKGARIELAWCFGDLPMLDGAHILSLTGVQGDDVDDTLVTYKDPNFGDAEIVVSLQQFAAMAAGNDLATERVRVTSVESEQRRRRRRAAALTTDQMDAELRRTRRRGLGTNDLQELAQQVHDQLYL